MKSTLKAAGLILAAVVLGLMTVQGTYALWNTAAPSNAGTIQAADFNILVNGSPMTPGPLTLNVGDVAKGQPRYQSVTVENAVNVTESSPLRLQASLVGLGPVKGFDGYLTVTAATVPIATACDLVAATQYTATPPAPVLAKDAPQKICLKADLNPNTPIAYLGRTIASTITLTVAQTAPVK
ncbi:hypothetical protein NNX28_14310 [Arthrobacter sp. zg-Y859]|uniref:SipW-cognate class signal peptide n=1 Tax=Arthrobacter jinronghuae TaxID=2964609 RepID=A0ABT1NTN0_9MICC|nr:hypothetical protein [Arthrobacter jinronghuae]MCQ1951093.1 hypothetical protein [Arthrobacter jinronghuae]MCQ1957279.1 hypothetical protein [Arthrobacter jinronghuae]UWX79544.1 hypothetical protein N2K98_04910 [Arthrobacter jinronghuae]